MQICPGSEILNSCLHHVREEGSEREVIFTKLGDEEL